MRPTKRFYVYIMTNGPLAAILYTGVTGNLRRRVWQHKNRLVEGFTSRYNLTSLVYYEEFVYPDAAIAREKEIKGWRRSKKMRLIQSMNPRWEDLALDWQEAYKPSDSATQESLFDESGDAPDISVAREIPRPAMKNAGSRDDGIR